MWHWPEDRHIYQWNTIGSPEINIYAYVQLIFYKDTKTIQTGRKSHLNFFLINQLIWLCWVSGFSGGSAGKESACNVGNLGLIPGLGRSPEEGNYYILQYSGLENSADCVVHGLRKNGTWLSDSLSISPGSQLRHVGSFIVACAVQSVGSVVAAYGLLTPRYVGSYFLDKGLNLCCLHWQVDS